LKWKRAVGAAGSCVWVLWLALAGCTGDMVQIAAPTPGPTDPGLGAVIWCTKLPWQIVSPRKPRDSALPITVDVSVHIMQVLMGAHREAKYKVDGQRWPWAIAPSDDAVMSKVNVYVPYKDTVKQQTVEYWTESMVDTMFGANTGASGKVREFWKKHDIQLNLVDVEKCAYEPRMIRPDRLHRDAMLTPQTTTPWTGQLFRSINRVFTEQRPGDLHVFLWWSVAEGDVDDAEFKKLEMLSGKTPIAYLHGNGVVGYSRSASRGGPAVWIGAYECLSPPDWSPDRCARLIAHEVGHAFGLHHVEEPDDNLMHVDVSKHGLTLDCAQVRNAQEEARGQFR